MTANDAIATIESTIAPDKLSLLQKEIFCRTWQGESYVKISRMLQYNHGYVKDVGAGLWRSLSEILGEKVNKHNLRDVLSRHQQRLTEQSREAAQFTVRQEVEDIRLEPHSWSAPETTVQQAISLLRQDHLLGGRVSVSTVELRGLLEAQACQIAELQKQVAELKTRI